MKTLEVIQKQEILGKSLTLYGDFDNPLFLAREVAEWIEHSNTRVMLQTVDEDEKVVNNVYTPGGNQAVWFLTEEGVYEVLMQSRKPIAKEFKKAVKAVLKSIRKHGTYMTTEAIEKAILNPDTVIRLCMELKGERQKVQSLETELAMKDQMLAELKPQETYYDIVMQKEDPVAMSRIAKDYDMAIDQINGILQQKGVVFYMGEMWFLTDKYKGKGYTRSKIQKYQTQDGKIHQKMHTYWTQKGRLLIYELLKNDDILPLIEQEVYVVR